jgi:hypothetical protein
MADTPRDRLLVVVTRMSDERENEFLMHDWWNLTPAHSPFAPPATADRALVVVHWKDRLLPGDWRDSASLSEPLARALADQVRQVMAGDTWHCRRVAVAYHHGGLVTRVRVPPTELETTVGRAFSAEAKVKAYSIGEGAPSPLAVRLQPLARLVGQQNKPLDDPEVMAVFDEAWVEATGLSELEAKLCLLHASLASAPNQLPRSVVNGALPRLLESEMLDGIAEGFYDQSLEALAEADPRYAAFRGETVRSLAEKLRGADGSGGFAEDRLLAVSALRDALLGQ